MTMHRRLLTVFAATLVSTAAFAEPPADGGPKRTRDSAGSIRNVNEIEDELVIVGKIQKPEVFYVLGRSDFSYRGIKLARTFVDEIRRSVRTNPF